MQRTIAWLLISASFLLAPLASHAEIEPRTSRCATPEGMTGAPGTLPGTAIPSAYTKGGLLAANEDWMAYAKATYRGDLMLRSRSGSEEFMLGRNNGDLSAIILDGSAVLCLRGEGALEIYKAERGPQGEPFFTHVFEQQGAEGERTLEKDGAGPMLLLGDGTLLVLDPFGALYTCNTDGSGLRKVAGTAIADFVYYDGMIYFANLDDPAEYKDVFCASDGEYSDLYYPTLYRMRLDGSGHEKLSDCGVWGLASQGNVILYQNMDEAFVFDVPENSGPRVLTGPLYRLDADTGKHRPLGIESNQYLPTPYGLAVWYNDFPAEPYEVERADLVLHDYDGKPLHRLDAGVIELFGACFAMGRSIEFYSYNLNPLIRWSRGLPDSRDGEGESEDVFTSVPLDGSPKAGGAGEVPAATGQAGHGDEIDDGDEEEGDRWEAFGARLNQRMATRTGPGTKYTEDHGTVPKDTPIVVYQQEKAGSTTWALVEYEWDGKLVRAYTGKKRIVANWGAVPSATKDPKTAAVIMDTAGYFGPGAAFQALKEPIKEGTEALVYGVDRGFALIEYPAGEKWMRSWVPQDAIAYE